MDLSLGLEVVKTSVLLNLKEMERLLGISQL